MEDYLEHLDCENSPHLINSLSIYGIVRWKITSLGNLKILVSFLLPAVLSLRSSVLIWVLLLQIKPVSLSEGSQDLLFVLSVLRCHVVVTWCHGVVPGWLYFHPLGSALHRILPSEDSPPFTSCSERAIKPHAHELYLSPVWALFTIKQDLHNCNRFWTPNSMIFLYAFNLGPYTWDKIWYKVTQQRRYSKGEKFTNQMQSVSEHRVEMRTQPSLSQLSALTVLYASRGGLCYQVGAFAFQMWSGKEESKSGESDSLLRKSSLFQGV